MKQKLYKWCKIILEEGFLENNAFPKSSRLDEITLENDEFSDISHSFVKLIEVDLKEYVRNHNI